MPTPAVLLYAPDGMQYQRYSGVRSNGVVLGRGTGTAGDGPNASGTDYFQRLPFGTQLILQDGRKFRFTLAGGTALAIGAVQQAAANVANHVGLTAVASALASRTPSATLGATATTGDQYAGGYVGVSVTPDAGNIYAIDTHAVALASADQLLTLAAGHAVRTSAWTTTSRVDLLKHPNDSVIVFPTTATQVAVGVAVTPLAAYLTTGAALSFGWLQTAGIASVLTNGTVVLGDGVYVAATTAGSVSATTATFAVEYTRIIGHVARVAATTAYSEILLNIDK